MKTAAASEHNSIILLSAYQGYSATLRDEDNNDLFAALLKSKEKGKSPDSDAMDVD